MEPPTEVCILSSDGDELHCCKHLLIEHSDFCKALFESGMKECQENCITLPSLSTQTIQLAIDFMQDIKPELTLENLSQALEVGTYLQMPHLTDFCLEAFKTIYSCDNCFEIGEIADQFMNRALQESAFEFMCSKFDLISRKKEFLLLPLDALLEVLKSSITTSSEKEIFDVGCLWIKRSKKRNINETINQVFECIRFPIMSVDDLGECKQTLQSMGIDTNCSAFSSIETALECLQDPKVLLKNDLGERALPRRMESCMLAMGGFTKSNATTNRLMIARLEQLQDLENDELTWQCHPPSRHYPRLPSPLCEHSVAMVGVFVYIAGGQTKYCQDGRHTSKDVYCLDTRNFRWVKVSPMKTPRSLFYLGALNKHLYAVGGWVVPDVVTKSVERYNVLEDKWEDVSRLEIGLHEHAGTTHDGRIYVSGGFKGPYRGHLDQVWSYSPIRDEWQQHTPMRHSRSYHCMVSTGSHLIVAGGVNYIEEDTFEDVKACEMFDPATNEWTTISQIPRFANCMSHCTIDNRVYIFGGHSFEHDTDHQYVQIFDWDTREWTEKLMDSKNVNFFACLIADLPVSIQIEFNR